MAIAENRKTSAQESPVLGDSGLVSGLAVPLVAVAVVGFVGAVVGFVTVVPGVVVVTPGVVVPGEVGGVVGGGEVGGVVGPVAVGCVSVSGGRMVAAVGLG